MERLCLPFEVRSRFPLSRSGPDSARCAVPSARRGLEEDPGLPLSSSFPLFPLPLLISFSSSFSCCGLEEDPRLAERFLEARGPGAGPAPPRLKLVLQGLRLRVLKGRGGIFCFFRSLLLSCLSPLSSLPSPLSFRPRFARLNVVHYSGI